MLDVNNFELALDCLIDVRTFLHFQLDKYLLGEIEYKVKQAGAELCQAQDKFGLLRI